MTEKELKLREGWMDTFWRRFGQDITRLEVRSSELEKVMKDNTFTHGLVLFTLNIKTLILDSAPDKLIPYESSEYDSTWLINLDCTGYWPDNGLKTLEITCGNRSDLPINWESVCRVFPQVENLRLCYHNEGFSYLYNILTAIKRMRGNGCKWELKSLDIIGMCKMSYSHDPVGQEVERTRMTLGEITQEICDLLESLKLPLQHLTIDFGKDTRPETMKSILKMYQKSLTKLDIYRHPESFPYKDVSLGVQMDNLRVLRMPESMCWSMSFLKYVPNLQVLHICEAPDGSWRLRGPQTRIIKNVFPFMGRNLKNTSVKDFRFDYDYDIDDLQRLIQWMPNVSKLMISFTTTEAIHTACNGWQLLTDLTVSPLPTRYELFDFDPGYWNFTVKHLANLTGIRKFNGIQDRNKLTSSTESSTGLCEYLKYYIELF